MKRVIRIRAEGIDLAVTIEGHAPPGVPRVLAREVRGVALDFGPDVTVTEEVSAEDVEK